MKSVTGIGGLVEAVRAAGIIGAGGAGFPTHAKLAAAVDTVIVNGAECEPLMFGDQLVMESRADALITGMSLVMDDMQTRLGKPVRGVICVKKKYKTAISAIQSEISGCDNLEILELDNIYPSGDEQYLVFEATGRIVPEGGIPPMVGALVMNVTTLVQVADASEGAPVTGRLMTLGGVVERPQVAYVPVGARFGEIVRAMGPAVDDYTLLVNGPMMGRLTDDMDDVTTKTMGGLFVLPKEHSHVRRMRRPLSTEIRLSRSACEVCRYCTDYCPRFLQGHSLEPHRVMRVINYDRDLDTRTITSAWLCCECGVCDLWACPMSLSPRVIFREFKRRLKDAGVKNPHLQSELTPDARRKFRSVPTDRLVPRLGLAGLDRRPPYNPNPPDISGVCVKLDQHIGAPATPVVRAGDKVRLGDLVADIPENSLGARYHASITGEVASVDDNGIVIRGAAS